MENVAKTTAGSYFPAITEVVRAVRARKRVVIGCMMARIKCLEVKDGVMMVLLIDGMLLNALSLTIELARTTWNI